MFNPGCNQVQSHLIPHRIAPASHRRSRTLPRLQCTPSTHTLRPNPPLTPSPHTLNPHPPPTPCTHTLLLYPLFTPSGKKRNSSTTHTINSHHQCTLSIHTANAYTPSTHPLNTRRKSRGRPGHNRTDRRPRAPPRELVHKGDRAKDEIVRGEVSHPMCIVHPAV